MDACKNGVCQSGQSICTEEQINGQGVGGNRPSLAALGNGRYVTQWTGKDSAQNYLRLSDGYGSREDRELKLTPSTATGQFSTRMAVSAIGDYLSMRWGKSDCNCEGYVKCGCDFGDLYVRHYNYDGSFIAEAQVEQNGVFGAYNSSQHAKVSAKIFLSRVVPLAFGNGTWAVVKGEEIGLSGPKPQLDLQYREIRYIPLDSQLKTGTSKTLISFGSLVNGSLFDTCLTSQDKFVLVWVGGGGQNVFVNEFNKDGKALSTKGAVVYSAVGKSVGGVRVACGHDGRFVVGFDINYGNANGYEILMRRYKALAEPYSGALVVNSKSPGDQRLGDITLLKDHTVVFTYDDASGDIDGYAVEARIMKWTGKPGSPIVVNTNVDGDQFLPTVAATGDDEFVVAFTDSAKNVFTRRFKSTGASDTGRPEMPVNTTITGNQSQTAVGTVSSGMTLLAYASPVPGKDTSEILARKVNSKGQLVGNEFQVNIKTTGRQDEPAVSGGSGRMAVTWDSVDKATDTLRVFLRLYDADIKPVSSEIMVNEASPFDQQDSSVAVDSNGITTVVWTGRDDKGAGTIFSRRYAADGSVLTQPTAVSGDIVLNHEEATVSALPGDKGFFVAWVTTDAKGGREVLMRRVNTDAAESTTPMLLGEANASQVDPQVALNSSGTVAAVCWTATNADPAISTQVACSLVETSGMTTTSNVLSTHSTIIGSQSQVAVTSLTTGDFLVGWTGGDSAIDASGTAVQYRRLSPSGAFSGPTVVANRYRTGDQKHLELIGITGGSFHAVWQSDGQDGSGDGLYMRIMPPP